MAIKRNMLDTEVSPYLLQHKDNPVFWMPWCEEAFEIAQAHNRIVFVSIGYSSCYWCHVMEEESFEDELVAKVLNDSFVSIKVDREERPDLDKHFMQGVVALTGHGGWPLNVFLTPQKEMFFGGTFFHKEQFVYILNEINKTWENRPTAISQTCRTLSEMLSKNRPGSGPGNSSIKASSLSTLTKDYLAACEHSFDRHHGGFGSSPKFPQTDRLRLLLRLAQSGRSEASVQSIFTLDRMSKGGLFDHLGGGFHRYSTDAQWTVPHFEKMLYDNALLALTYFEASQYSGRSDFQQTGERVLNFLLDEMALPQGGFASAFDAGEVNSEGDYYIWSGEELNIALTSQEKSLLVKAFDIPLAADSEDIDCSKGNFDSDFFVLRIKDTAPLSLVHSPEVRALESKLLELRSQRPKPLLDDKLVVSWNGLAISALCKGFQITGNTRYKQEAERTGNYITSRMLVNGVLHRRLRLGNVKYAACLDDYAFLIQGLIDLHQSTLDKKWLESAIYLQSLQDKFLWRHTAGGFAYSSATDIGKTYGEVTYEDDSLPSPNAVSALNLHRMSRILHDTSLAERARTILESALGNACHYPLAYAGSILVALQMENEAVDIGISGDLTTPFLSNLLSYVFSQPKDNWILNTHSGISSHPETPTAFICRDAVCYPPVRSLNEAINLLEHSAPLTSLDMFPPHEINWAH